MRTDEYGAKFLEGIVSTMVELFGISEEEAIGRINRDWTWGDLVGQPLVVYHEDPEYWAKTIYYGTDSYWWIKEEKGEKIDPIPYP